MADGSLLLAWLHRVAVLTRYDLDLLRGDHLVRLHLEGRVLHDERPHVVTESVGLQVTLQRKASPKRIRRL